MLGILIPLKSKKVSKDWGITCKNLEATVKSVIAQDNRNFRAVVVGHEKPEVMAKLQSSDNCEFVYFDEFEPPKPGKNEAENQLKYEFDRCSKILKGIMYLTNTYDDIGFWFSLDADDLISSKFVEEILNYKSYKAIVLDKGYFYFKSTGLFNKENEFSAYCGSSSVLSSDLVLPVPDKISKLSFREIPFGNISHVNMKSWLTTIGVEYKVPKQRLVVYVRDNGENISNDAYCNTPYKKLKKNIKMLLRTRLLSKADLKKFGL